MNELWLSDVSTGHSKESYGKFSWTFVSAIGVCPLERKNTHTLNVDEQGRLTAQ